MTMPMVAAAIWGVVVAGFGAWMTDLSPWYYGLRKPGWKPPDWLFGPAWTIILTLASYAAYLGWQNAPGEDSRRLVAGLFVLNGLANIVWSLLFFRQRRPDRALAEVVVLWLSIAALIVVLAPISATASLAMAPYLVWVSFASVLNLSIVRQNYPFKGRNARGEPVGAASPGAINPGAASRRRGSPRAMPSAKGLDRGDRARRRDGGKAP